MNGSNLHFSTRKNTLSVRGRLQYTEPNNLKGRSPSHAMATFTGRISCNYQNPLFYLFYRFRLYSVYIYIYYIVLKKIYLCIYIYNGNFELSRAIPNFWIKPVLLQRPASNLWDVLASFSLAIRRCQTAQVTLNSILWQVSRGIYGWCRFNHV